ncbi:MAG: YCF48-related protein [Candidatus Eremiobacterota bacterium]
MAKKLLISIVLISIISGIVIAGCGDSGSNQIVVPATGTPTQIASFVTIKGQALEVNGTPIPNAFVVCVNLGLSASLSTLADQLGNYIFRNLPPGTYRIEIWRTEGEHSSSPGSPIGAVNITVTEGSVTVNVTVGTIDPTPTPTSTNTPGGPTNTPGGPTNTPTSTNTPGGPTNTPTATNTPGGPTNTPVPSPTITSVNPSSGAVGDNVVITGNYFVNVTSVTFSSSVSATYTVNSATQITATVPSGAVTGVITVTTSTGSATVGFTMKSWHDISSNLTSDPNNLLDVTFSGNEVWIAGDKPGELYHSTNGGTSFNVVAFPAPVYRSKLTASNGGTEYVTSLFMRDPNDVWAATTADGNVGRVLRWNGSTLSAVGNTVSALNSICFPPSGNIGYCCGGTSTTSYVGQINSSSMTITPFASPVGVMTGPSIVFPDSSDKIWISYNYANPYATIDYYANSVWQSAILPNMGYIDKLYFLDKSNGWAVGCDDSSPYNMASISYYGGTSWTTIYTSTDYTVMLRDIFFRNTTEGWSVGRETVSPRKLLVLHTTDGGSNWTKQLEETPTNPILVETFNAVYFSSDGSIGFAVGNNKRVYKYY